MNIKPVFKFVFLFLLLLIFSYTGYGQCSITQSLEVNSLQDNIAEILIEGSVNDNLAGSQGVCGIAVEFEHDQIGELNLKLRSPAGQVIELTGPEGSFGATDFASWDLLFVPCAIPGSPDPGFTEQWNNNQSWAVLGDYTGIYHPFLGCLESFNVGSVNGIWTVIAEDETLFDEGLIINFTIFFCDDTGISCSECQAYGGEFTQDTLTVCENDVSTTSIEPNFPEGNPADNFLYFYVVKKDNELINISQNLNLESIGTGEFEVCGISILDEHQDQIITGEFESFDELVNAIEMDSDDFCADLSDNCVKIFINALPNAVFIDTTLCPGEVFNFLNQTFDISGIYQFIEPSQTVCDTPYVLIIDYFNLEIVLGFTAQVLTCNETQIRVDASQSIASSSASFFWSTSNGNIVSNVLDDFIILNHPGEYFLTIQQGACQVTESFTITADADFPIISLSSSTLNCVDTTTTINLNSSEALQSIIWTGPNGFNSQLEDPLIEQAGSYTVTTTSFQGCVSTNAILVEQEINEVNIEFTKSDLSCLNPSVTIQTVSDTDNLIYSWTGPNSYIYDGPSPVVSEPGIYQLTAIDPLGCKAVYFVEVLGNLEEIDFDLDIPIIYCSGETVTVNLTSEAENPFILWEGEGLMGEGYTFSTNITGNYSVTISSNGCSETVDFEIIKDLSEIPNADPFQDEVLDCTNLSCILYPNITSNLDNVVDIMWRDPDGNFIYEENPEVSVLGNYNLILTTISGCKRSYSLSLEVSTNLPKATIVTTTINCANKYGSFNVNPDNSVETVLITGPNGYADVGTMQDSLLKGKYIITLIDSSGCKRSYKRSITSSIKPLNIDIFSTNELNCKLNQAKIYATDGFTDITWLDEFGVTTIADTLLISSTGTYYVEAIGSNFCSTKDSIVIGENIVIPQVTANDAVLTCEKSAVALHVNSNAQITNYKWSGPGSFSSTKSSPIASEVGSYFLTVTGINGCTNSTSLELVYDTIPPNAFAEFDQSFDCNILEVTISGSSTNQNVSYLWLGPEDYLSEQPVNSISLPGLYSFFVTGKNGCKTEYLLDVPFIGSPPQIEAIGDTVQCNDLPPTINVESEEIGLMYSWTGPNGYTSDMANNIVAEEGNYYVEVLGADGCISYDTVQIAYDTLQTAITLENVLDTLNCQNTSMFLDLTSNLNVQSVFWQGPNGFTNNQLDVDISDGGLYEVVVTAYNNCTSNFEIIVEQDTVTPLAEIFQTIITCNDTFSEIYVNSIDSIIAYSWEGPNDFVSQIQNPELPEAGMYELVITGLNYCQTVYDIEVEADFSTPDISTKNDTLPCDGTAVTLFADSGIDVTYLWTGPNSFQSNIQNPSTAEAGIYNVQVTGANGCTSMADVEILDLNYLPTINVVQSNEFTCDEDSVNLIALNVANNELIFWSGPSGFQSEQDSITINQDGLYFVEVVGYTGCSSYDTIEITIDTISPYIQINQTGIIMCDFDEFSLDGFGTSSGPDFTYLWTTNGGNIMSGSETLNPEVDGEGIYILYAKNNYNGCINSDSISVQEIENSLEDILVKTIPPSCVGDENGQIQIIGVNGGFPPFEYAIEGLSYSDSLVYRDVAPGLHQVYVRDSFGCIFEVSIELNENSGFAVDLGNDFSIELGDSIHIYADVDLDFDEIDSIDWYPKAIIDCVDCLDFGYSPLKNEKITLTIYDKNGCIESDDVIIIVDNTPKIYVPNIFSPNGDGINDIFMVSKSSNVKEVRSFRIYDRWGSRVHEQSNYIPGEGIGWDGMHLGKPAIQGMYPYVLELEMIDGSIQLIKKDLTLLR